MTIIDAILSYITNLALGAKMLTEMIFSPEGMDYMINGGGWLVFLKGVLKGIIEARYGIYF